MIFLAKDFVLAEVNPLDYRELITEGVDILGDKYEDYLGYSDVDLYISEIALRGHFFVGYVRGEVRGFLLVIEQENKKGVELLASEAYIKAGTPLWVWGKCVEACKHFARELGCNKVVSWNSRTPTGSGAEKKMKKYGWKEVAKKWELEV